MKGWDNLPKEHTFKCETHDSMKKLIEKKENAGEVKIIKCKKCCRRTINLTSIEKKLRRKEMGSHQTSHFFLKYSVKTAAARSWEAGPGCACAPRLSGVESGSCRKATLESPVSLR